MLIVLYIIGQKSTLQKDLELKYLLTGDGL